MDLQLPRGMRDIPPEEKLFRDDIVSRMKRIFERFGFSPIETPLVERYDVLAGKYAGGAEILKETFRFTDQGGRELGLRYDLTVPLSRYVAMHQDVKLPFKRYQIERVYRDGPIKLGRTREFYQCDCDIVGAQSALSDAQCLELGRAVFRELDLDVTFTCNHVGLLREILTREKVPEHLQTQTLLILDKLKKIGRSGVEKEFHEAGIPIASVVHVLSAAAQDGNTARIAALKVHYRDLSSLSRVEEIVRLVPGVVFDPSLSRGLAYYTGIVFEGFLADGTIASSLAAGGRYDRMVGSLAERPDDFPAVGISFGLEPIMEALKDRIPARKTATTVFICPIGTPDESVRLAARLREEGVNTDLDLVGRSISKNIEYAAAMGIPYVLFLGKQELAQGKCKLRNLASGEESLLSPEDIAGAVRQ